MMLFYLFTTVSLPFLISVQQTNGLKCYNCHSKCPTEGESQLSCDYSQIYLNTIAYNRSRDGPECPSEHAEWSDSKYAEECEESSFCGKREISIHVKISSDDKEVVGVTTYPILNTKRIYHRVYGCMRPKTDCDRKTFDKVIRNKSSSKNETITISGKIVEEADCRKCQHDLCNAEEQSHQHPSQDDSEHKPSNSFANFNDPSMLLLILSAIMMPQLTLLVPSL